MQDSERLFLERTVPLGRKKKVVFIGRIRWLSIPWNRPFPGYFLDACFCEEYRLEKHGRRKVRNKSVKNRTVFV